MTIKELAEVAGVSRETIRRTGKDLFPGMHTKGVKTHYTKNQCEILMREVKKKNMVSIPTQNEQEHAQNVEVNYNQNMMAFMLKMQEQQNQFMAAVLNKLEGITQPPQQTQKALPYVPEITDRVRVKNLVNAYTVKTGGEFRDTWNMLYKEFNDRHNMNIHQRAYNAKVLIIDAVDSLGMMPDLLALANMIFANDFLIEND